MFISTPTLLNGESKMAIRTNRGRPSLKSIKAKYKKKYGANWFNNTRAMAAYRREVEGKKTKSRSSSKSRSGRKLTAYQRFVKSQAGKGWSMSKIADEWRKQGKPGQRSSSKRRASKPSSGTASKSKALRAKYRKAYGNDWWEKPSVKARYDKGLSPLKKSSSKSSKSRSKSKSKGGKRKLSAWNRFVRKHKGKGLGMAKLADMARKQGVLK